MIWCWLHTSLWFLIEILEFLQSTRHFPPFKKHSRLNFDIRLENTGHIACYTLLANDIKIHLTNQPCLSYLTFRENL